MKKKIITVLICIFSLPFLIAAGNKKIELYRKNQLIVDFSKAIDFCEIGGDEIENKPGEDISASNPEPEVTKIGEITSKIDLAEVDHNETEITVKVRGESIIYDGKKIDIDKLDARMKSDWGKNNNTNFVPEDYYADNLFLSEVLKTMNQTKIEIGKDYHKELIIGDIREVER